MPQTDSSFPPAPPPASVASGPFACGLHTTGRGAAWVTPSGELDLAGVPELERALEQARGSALVVIDLRRLTFIDSTGLHAIVAADARARRADQRVVLVRGPETVDRVFALTGVRDHLRIVDLTPSHP